ncbi:hypothetical protein NMG60_11031482 [Bertholletia excelsa]
MKQQDQGEGEEMEEMRNSEGKLVGTSEKEEAHIITSSTATTSVSFSYNPCHYLQEVIQAFLRCLGFESSKPDDQTSSSEEGESPSQEAADPPSVTDSPSDPPPIAEEDAAASLRTRRPPPPPFNTGTGPQTNSQSS